MRGQSSYTSWYFIEHAEIGDFNINVTIALTSSVLTNRAAAGSVALPENRGGLFSRLIGASGFQLINVNNVPLQLRSWSTDTQLLGRKALIGTLSRHYLNNGIREAHKVGTCRDAHWVVKAEPARYTCMQAVPCICPDCASCDAVCMGGIKGARWHLALSLSPHVFDGLPLCLLLIISP